MSNGWLTLSDAFSPYEIMDRDVQIKQAQMAIAQAQQENQRSNEFEQWKNSQNGVSTQTPGVMPMSEIQPTQPDPEQIRLIRGQSKIQTIMPEITRMFSDPAKNSVAIAKINQMQKNDKDVQSVLGRVGYEDVDIGYNDKTKTAWQKFTKNWSEEELAAMAKNIPGGNVLTGLPAGRYTIDFDPVKRRLRPSVQSSVIETKNNLTADASLIRDSLREKLNREPTATEILQEKQRIDAESYSVKYGSDIGSDAINFAAEQYVATGKMPEVGRTAKLRSAILQRSAEIKKDRGLTTSQVIGEQTKLSATKKSFTKTKQMNDADIRYAEELYADIDRLKTSGLVERIRGTAPKMLNMSRRKLRDAIASKQFLGDEMILAQELDGIMNEFARISLGTTDSIADLSEGSKKRYQELIDIDRPSFVIIRQLDQIKKSTEDRLASRARVLKNLEEQISGEKIEKKETTKKMVFNPSTRRIE